MMDDCGFVWNISASLMFYVYLDLRNSFPFYIKLLITQDHLVEYTSVSGNEAPTFSPCMIPPEFENLIESSYFHDNIRIHASAIRICFLITEHNWRLWFHYQGLTGISHLRTLCAEAMT